MDIVRVLRVLEYVGPRDQVEIQLEKSIQGQRKVRDVLIKAATIGTYPEVLDAEGRTKNLKELTDQADLPGCGPVSETAGYGDWGQGRC